VERHILWNEKDRRRAGIYERRLSRPRVVPYCVQVQLFHTVLNGVVTEESQRRAKDYTNP
jgi:hypothetical protein